MVAVVFDVLADPVALLARKVLRQPFEVQMPGGFLFQPFEHIQRIISARVQTVFHSPGKISQEDPEEVPFRLAVKTDDFVDQVVIAGLHVRIVPAEYAPAVGVEGGEGRFAVAQDGERVFEVLAVGGSCFPFIEGIRLSPQVAERRVRRGLVRRSRPRLFVTNWKRRGIVRVTLVEGVEEVAFQHDHFFGCGCAFPAFDDDPSVGYGRELRVARQEQFPDLFQAAKFFGRFRQRCPELRRIDQDTGQFSVDEGIDPFLFGQPIPNFGGLLFRERLFHFAEIEHGLRLAAGKGFGQMPVQVQSLFQSYLIIAEGDGLDLFTQVRNGRIPVELTIEIRQSIEVDAGFGGGLMACTKQYIQVDRDQGVRC